MVSWCKIALALIVCLAVAELGALQGLSFPHGRAIRSGSNLSTNVSDTFFAYISRKTLDIQWKNAVNVDVNGVPLLFDGFDLAFFGSDRSWTGHVVRSLARFVGSLMSQYWTGGYGSVVEHGKEYTVPGTQPGSDVAGLNERLNSWQGLAGAVNVSFDDLGRPTVVSVTENDGYFAQGFLHASERLWQMEALRRLCFGTLAAAVGSKALDADRFSRHMGFAAKVDADLMYVRAEQPSAMRALEAYVAGINHFVEIARRKNTLPLEFRLLGLALQPWRSHDTLCTMRLLMWMMTKGHDGEMVRAALYEAVGTTHAEAIDPAFIADGMLERGLIQTHHGPEPISAAQREALRAVWSDRQTIPNDLMEQGSMLHQQHWRRQYNMGDGDPDLFETAISSFGGFGGSNAWAVSGKHTLGGKPIVASDPHLPMSQPSIWYQMRLVTRSVDDAVSGASIPGSPGIQIGTTSAIAWAVTLARLDVEDLFVERFRYNSGRNCSFFCDSTETGACSASSPLCNACEYEFEGRLRPCRIAHEKIYVKGRNDPATIATVSTHHGTMFPAELIGFGSNNIVLRSTVMTEPPPLDGFLGLRAAKNSLDFMKAVRQIRAPPLNIVFGTSNGDIGHVVSGAAPIRGARLDADGTNAESPLGLFPAPGWTGTHEWLGYVSSEDMPHALNPVEGYIVSANNHIGLPGAHAWIGGTFQAGWRARRLTELLQAQIKDKMKITTKFCSQMQNDIRNLGAVEFMSRVVKILGTNISSSPTRRAFDTCLRGWDGEMAALSCAPTLFTALKQQLFRLIFENALARAGASFDRAIDLTQQAYGRAPRVLLKPGNDWLGWDVPILVHLLDAALIVEQQSTPGNVSHDDAGAAWWTRGWASSHDLVEKALSEATTGLQTLFGRLSEPEDWIWGAVHYQDFLHSLGRNPILATMLNQGPLARGGDQDTPNMGATLPHTGMRSTGWAPSYRQIVDFARNGTLVSGKSRMPMQQTVLPPGQSGAIHSAHYGDQIDAWLEGYLYDVDAPSVSTYSFAPSSSRN